MMIWNLLGLQRFLKRHPLLEISYGKAMDIQRLLALDSNTITTYFDKVAEPRLPHKMDLDDIWNTGEDIRGTAPRDCPSQ
jgi:hypothetical protein